MALSCWLVPLLFAALVAIVRHAEAGAEEAPCGPTAGTGNDACTATATCDSIGGRLAALLFLIASGTCGAGYVFYRSSVVLNHTVSTDFDWSADPPLSAPVEMRPMTSGAAPSAKRGQTTTSPRYDYVRPGVDF